eukprot:TRINITY_DN862_c0_g1_i15.p1 TRINITY_DN862_c0_g1~~TRINITY_DN862_c0_g1_i15.p1  ORF type:complete len:114 (+),score=45.93 TRINITY_DN862_c0_g1_i15:109-450(+)
MIRRPPRSTLSSSSAASDVYKRQGINAEYMGKEQNEKEEKQYLGLKEDEIKLAESLQIQIYDYILIRDVIIREAAKQAFISKEYIENLIKIDKVKLAAIFDYLLQHHDILEKQ